MPASFIRNPSGPRASPPRCVLPALSALAVIAVLATASTARADVYQQFYLKNVGFVDGGAAAGTFTVDESVGTISNIAITITDPVLSITPFEITGANISSAFESGNYAMGIFSYADGGIGLGFFFPNPADPIAGMTDYMTAQSSFQYNNFSTNVAFDAGAAISPFPAPEPATPALIGTAILGLCMVRRRSRSV